VTTVRILALTAAIGTFLAALVSTHAQRPRTEGTLETVLRGLEHREHQLTTLTATVNVDYQLTDEGRRYWKQRIAGLQGFSELPARTRAKYWWSFANGRSRLEQLGPTDRDRDDLCSLLSSYRVMLWNGEQHLVYTPFNAEALIHEMDVLDAVKFSVMLGFSHAVEVPLSTWLRASGVRLEGQELVDGHTCYVLAAKPDDGVLERFWIDPGIQFAPRRHVEYWPNGDPSNTTEYAYGDASLNAGLWLPSRMCRRKCSSKTLHGSVFEFARTIYDFSNAAAGIPLEGSLFDFTESLAPGVSIMNAVTSERSVVENPIAYADEVMETAQLARRLLAHAVTWEDAIASHPGTSFPDYQGNTIARGRAENRSTFSACLDIAAAFMSEVRPSSDSRPDNDTHNIAPAFFKEMERLAAARGLSISRLDDEGHSSRELEGLLVMKICDDRWALSLGRIDDRWLIVLPPTLLVLVPEAYKQCIGPSECVVVSGTAPTAEGQ